MSAAVQQQLSRLLLETTQAHFLRTLAPYEVLPALEARREQVRHLLKLVAEEARVANYKREILYMIMDHTQSLLEAELHWLDRAIERVQAHN
jgi:hypothetical protein